MSACPDEEAMFALVHGRLPRENAALIAAHADECVACHAALGEVARLVMGEARRAPMRASSAPLKAADVLADRYRLTKLLGEGGAGIVWAADDLRGGAPVALKFLRSDDPRLVRRLLREARLARALAHPSLVPVHEILTLTDRPPALVLELLEGESLAARLARGAIEAAVATRMMAIVCDAVAALHGASIIHRDLKPSNIFLARRAEGTPLPRVLDLGMAKQLAGAGAGTKPTTAGALLGTPRYMAPEQLVASGTADERADVWALGALLYESIAGAPHVDAHRPAHVLRAIAKGIRPLGEVAPAVPAVVATLCMRMLSVDRRLRPSAAEAATTLRA